MQGIGNHLGQSAVGLHRGGNVEGLHGYFYLVEVLFFQQADFPQCRGHHVVDDAVIALMGFTGLGQLVDQVHVAGEAPGTADAAHRRQAAEVDSNTDGNTPGLGGLDHLAHLVFVSQVAWVQA